MFIKQLLLYVVLVIIVVIINSMDIVKTDQSMMRSGQSDDQLKTSSSSAATATETHATAIVTDATTADDADATTTDATAEVSDLQTTRRPNIVIFIADDLGIGDVGCFGNSTIRTPNIDRIAREGAKLTHHLAAEALCTPSRAAFMTARYPIRSGMATSQLMRVLFFSSCTGGLPSNETTIGEEAKRLGYSTALIGKWHLGLHCGLHDLNCHHPLNQGFDYFYGLPMSNSETYSNTYKRKLYPHIWPNLDTILTAIVLGGIFLALVMRRMKIIGNILTIILFLLVVIPPGYIYFVLNNSKYFISMIMRNYEVVEQPIQFENLTQNLVTEGKRFLQAQAQAHHEAQAQAQAHTQAQAHSAAPDKPFLLVMPWVQVHTIMHAGKRFQGHSVHGEYGDNVEEMDWSVGQILEELELLGYLENTLVYFTSDNGGHLELTDPRGNREGGWNGIYRGGKGQSGMDGGIRMPTVVMWKGQIMPNTVIDVPTSHMDILPTLLSIWNQPLPVDRVLDGRNIYPLLTGKNNSSPHQFLFHYCGTVIHAARYIPGTNGDVYKVYYYTPKWLPGAHTCRYMCNCLEANNIRHTSPLLYNIGQDPSERLPLPVHASCYRDIVELVNRAVKEHQQGIQSVPSQFSIGNLVPRPWLQNCCNFPYCGCKDPVYNPPQQA